MKKKSNEIIVLGYDQGIANAGCCVMSYDKKTKKKRILFKKHFVTMPHTPVEERVKLHYDFLMSIVKKYKVQAIACERLMFNSFGGKRKKSASMMTVNTISAIIMLVAANNNIKFREFMPMTVKKRFTGNGKATKDDIINETKRQYRLRKTPIEHTADAIAIADTLIDELIN